MIKYILFFFQGEACPSFFEGIPYKMKCNQEHIKYY